ncbi:MAG TPA: hypothetical protein GXZ87_01945 [Bacteroidales bacterium]|nr:hypothetical protein [Bacteroidales bacterium]
MKKILFALLIVLFVGCQSKEKEIIKTIAKITNIQPENEELGTYRFPNVSLKDKQKIEYSLDRNLGVFSTKVTEYSECSTWETTEYKVIACFNKTNDEDIVNLNVYVTVK